jgi:hypothetical protein
MKHNRPFVRKHQHVGIINQAVWSAHARQPEEAICLANVKPGPVAYTP